MSKTRRRVAHLAISLSLAGSATSCSDLGFGEGDSYALTALNGIALPAVASTQTMPDGSQRTVTVASGIVVFYPRGTFRTEIVVHVHASNVARDSVRLVRLAGAFEMLGDTAVTTRFRDTKAWNRTTYRILEKGNLLRAIQSVESPLAVYDYRRQ